MERVTVFTPTYNRGNVLHRVYDSLVNQTFTDCKWVIVDDGSTDDTKSVVDRFIAEGKIPIEYYYQKNQGKHIATNFAVSLSTSELFLIADSDDAFTDRALELLVAAWDSIPETERDQYKGVICRCFDSQTGEPIGKFLQRTFDSNDLDAYFRLNLDFEKWMLFRTDVLKEFPFPDEGDGLKFFPETVVWQEMARKYKTRYIDDALREYFRDQTNALTNAKTPRYRENTFLWAHYINDTMDYFWYKPLLFLKSFVGLSRDNIAVGKGFRKIMGIPNKAWKKAVCAIFYPVGWALSRPYRKQYRQCNWEGGQTR